MTFRDILEAFRRCDYTLEAIKQSSLRLCCLLSLSKDPPYTCSKPAQYKMPEVIRGIRSHEGAPGTLSRQETPTSPLSNHRVTFEQEATSSPVRHTASHESRKRRQSLNLSERAESDAYYDSRAATKKEFRRRASTLQEYYREHPTLLPQLPFTWHHGWKRYRLGLFVTFMFLDAWLAPILPLLWHESPGGTRAGMDFPLRCPLQYGADLRTLNSPYYQ